jgi:hypothetical protein
MTEQEIRAVVRETLARIGGATRAAAWPPGQVAPGSGASPLSFREHASHGTFAVPEGADSGGACVIEPAVACNHCGYCKSYGH